MAESKKDDPSTVEVDTKTAIKNNQKELDESSAARQDRDADAQLATADVPITAVDALGVERIILNSPAGYTPPQVEPDPKEVERLKNLQTRLDNRKSERLEQLTKDPDAGGQVAAAAIKAESGHTVTHTDPKADTTTAAKQS